MENELLTKAELDQIFQEMQEEWFTKRIAAILKRQRRIARGIAKKRYGISLGFLPHNVRKGILNEAADIITDEIIQESGGSIH